MEIKSLSGIDFDVIFTAFEKAFADYELQQDKTQLRIMLKRRGFDPGLSFAAFDNGRILGFTFNGIGEFEGIPTAYDTGTGTLKEFRGQGLATRIFEYSIPHLKAVGIRQYLLEVLQHNTKAVSVYRNLGFEISREFNYFIQENSKVRNDQEIRETFSVRPITFGQVTSAQEYWDFYPSWQNSFDSIRRSEADFVCLGVFENERLVGYCVFEPVSGDITQLAVDKGHRRRGAASLMLREMTGLNLNNKIKAVNTDVTCDPVTEFMMAKNIALQGKQFEMIRKL